MTSTMYHVQYLQLKEFVTQIPPREYNNKVPYQIYPQRRLSSPKTTQFE